MFTVLTIEKRELKGIKRLFCPFLRDKITEEYKEQKSLVVRNIHYISRREQINFGAIYERSGYDSQALVCSEDIVFPKVSGLARFVSSDFNKLMTENFALEILKTMENPSKLKIVFLDLEGEERAFAERLSMLSDNFVIITDEKEKYFNLSNKMMSEKGVSLVITERYDRMSSGDFIIAPSRIRKITHLSHKALVLTSEKPCVDVAALCYSTYKTELPEKYKYFLPSGIDEEYFLSALYSRGRQYSLSSLVPKVAYNENSTCTVKSMAKYLDRLCV